MSKVKNELPKSMLEIYLSLGSNLGDRNRNFDEAISRLNTNLLPYASLERESNRIETEPWGFVSSDKFLNSVLVYRANIDLTPRILLEICKKIEGEMGRISSVQFDENNMRIYHSRIIDIDILLFDNQVVKEFDLVIPHPLISERDFILIPLKEVSSYYINNLFPALFV